MDINNLKYYPIEIFVLVKNLPIINLSVDKYGKLFSHSSL